MNLSRMLLLATLVAGLLFLHGAVGAQNVKSSTDEKGTVPAGTTPPASQEKTGEVKAKEKAGEMKEPCGPLVPPGQARRNANPRSRRDYFGQASAPRRQAIKDDLLLFRPNPANPNPTTPVPLMPPDQLPPASPATGPPAAPPAAPPGSPPQR